MRVTRSVPKLIPSPKRVCSPNRRILFVPRKSETNYSKRRSQNVFFDALKTPSLQRVNWQVDLIMTNLKNWPVFASLATNEIELKQLCQNLSFNLYKSNTTLFREGDICDCLYIVYSGKISLYKEKGDHELELIREVGIQEEIGKENLMKKKFYEYTGIIEEDTYLIAIYSEFYSKTIKTAKAKERNEKAFFLKGTEELKALSQYNFEGNYDELYYRLADELEEINIPMGANYKQYCHGWLIIKSGCLAKRRRVNFKLSTIDHRIYDTNAYGLTFPDEEILITTDEFGPYHCVADPSLSKELRLNKPFSLKAQCNTIAYTLSYDTIKRIIPYNIRREIESIILNDPTDDFLIRQWYEKEKAIKWVMYRNCIDKDARHYLKQDKTEKTEKLNRWACKTPKPLKDYQSRQISPRRLAQNIIHG